MPITKHSVDQKGQLIYTIATPEFDLIEDQVWKQLKNEPERIEMYQYFFNDDPRLPIPKTSAGNEDRVVQAKIQAMIHNNMVQGNYEAALDLVDAMIIAKRKPTLAVILFLFDLILRPTTDITLLSAKELLRVCQRAQRSLLFILEVFGASLFGQVWHFFRVSNLGRLQQRMLHHELAEMMQQDEDDEIYEAAIAEFDDLWDLVALCIGHVEAHYQSGTERPTPSMEAPAGKLRRRMALDVFISVLEYDLRARRESDEALAQCMFLKMLRVDGSGNRTQFGRYLDIIFSAFGLRHKNDGENAGRVIDPESVEFAGRLLNMNAVATKPLVFQTFQRFTKMDIDGCASLMQVIKCTTFLATLCDMYLSDADCTRVPAKYQNMRKASTYSLEKLFRFNPYTAPLQLKGLKSVLRHVLIVYWRYATFIHERFMRCEVCCSPSSPCTVRRFHLSTLTDDQREHVMMNALESVAGWREHVESMIQEAKQYERDPITEQHIRAMTKLLEMEWEL
ncbi:hypothetical protein BX666DRAFT_2032676 [Dichotomocladium elegans]|nr:hypothetical protein BX666DRAFT_2032676 [Dichotomocladium elegans]